MRYKRTHKGSPTSSGIKLMHNKSTKEIKTIYKKHTHRNFGAEGSTDEMRNTLENIGTRPDRMDKRISELNDKNLENT